MVKDLLQNKKIVDKVMLFTDCQLWNSKNSDESIAGLWKQYKQLAPTAKLYLQAIEGGSDAVKIIRQLEL